MNKLKLLGPLLMSIMSQPSLAHENSCPAGPYIYYADVIDIYDADTISVNIDLGFHTWRMNEKLRLSGINAPEMKGEEREKGIISRDWLRGQILNKQIIIKSVKSHNKSRGKYGRYLAELYLPTEEGCINLNDELVRLALAEYKEY